MTGGSSSSSDASGWRRKKSSKRSRAFNSPTVRSRTMWRPSPDNPVSASSAAAIADSRSIRVSSPKSDRPVASRASATMPAASRSTRIDRASSYIACSAGARLGSRRSPIRTSLMFGGSCSRWSGSS